MRERHECESRQRAVISGLRHDDAEAETPRRQAGCTSPSFSSPERASFQR